MFEIDIPEVDYGMRTLEQIVRHMAKAVDVHSNLPTAKQVKESVDMVIAFMNKELSYSDALQNIYSIGDGMGISGVCLGSIVIDLNDTKEIMYGEQTYKRENI